ncbi:ABC transporter permease [Streptomyces triticagri]|uniref:ABC transporter permease n=1 Tax=Streptomyces triticagri TaxID=2293568 RepID=A0A372M402_9ACTN|nr:ABC transporter permease [Streptomyces triticagri]RFU85666.1 ABC transporter permease [Streptomyces triticagri]
MSTAAEPTTSPRPAAPAVIRSEWIKVRSVRASLISLVCIVAVTLTVTLLVFPTVGQAEADNPGADLLFNAFYALNFAQIAAICFGATAVSSEYRDGALRVSLSAVPRRGLLYASKMTVIGALGIAAGILTAYASFAVGQAFMGEYAIGLDEPGALRACTGGGIYLGLMALFAAGVTVLLRSGAGTLGLLIPFTLIVSFVIGDMSSTAADLLPDRAGQVVLYQDAPSGIGPWQGLGISALWALAAVLAGWWAFRRRDA